MLHYDNAVHCWNWIYVSHVYRASELDLTMNCRGSSMLRLQLTLSDEFRQYKVEAGAEGQGDVEEPLGSDERQVNSLRR
jgi:hypothetical protein